MYAYILYVFKSFVKRKIRPYEPEILSLLEQKISTADVVDHLFIRDDSGSDHWLVEPYKFRCLIVQAS